MTLLRSHRKAIKGNSEVTKEGVTDITKARDNLENRVSPARLFFLTRIMGSCKLVICMTTWVFYSYPVNRSIYNQTDLFRSVVGKLKTRKILRSIMVSKSRIVL